MIAVTRAPLALIWNQGTSGQVPCVAGTRVQRPGVSSPGDGTTLTLPGRLALDRQS